MTGKFDLHAAYLKHATGFERVQLEGMRLVIEAKAGELRDLRYERDRLAKKINARGTARARADRAMGRTPGAKL